MIKLNKGLEPLILSANKANWTAQLFSLRATGQVIPDSLATKYNHPDIKNALRVEGSGKCMYCESKVEHIADLNIEHIKPKAANKFPELTYEYDNLGLACTVCNRNKSSTYDMAVPFINPYTDDPVNHFNSIGAFIWAIAGDNRAKLTEIEIELNRPDLLEARADRMKSIRSLIDSYHSEKNPTLKTSLKNEIFKEVDRDKVYSFCTSTLVNALM